MVSPEMAGTEETTKIAEYLKALLDYAKRITVDGVPDDRVRAWLQQPRQKPIFVAGAVLALFLIAKVFAEIQSLFGTDVTWSEEVLSFQVLNFVEALVLVIFVLYVVLKGNRNEKVTLTKGVRSVISKKQLHLDEEKLQLAAAAENRFFSYWSYLWVLWFFLYVTLGMSTALGMGEPDTTAAQKLYAILCNVLNSLTCIPFLGMYYELENIITDSTKTAAKRTWLGWILALIAIAALAEYALGVYLAGYSGEVAYWSSLLSGMLVGVCTGLFISKLTSRLFDLPLWTLLLLTLYVILQPVFAVITSNQYQSLSYLMVLIALYTKIVLLVVVEWKRDKHRILYFMTRAAEIVGETKAYEEFSTVAEKLFGRRPYGWHFLKTRFFPIFGTVLLALLVLGIVSSAERSGLESLRHTFVYLDFAEALFLFGFALWVFARGTRNHNIAEKVGLSSDARDQLSHASIAENQFFSYWTVLLFSWSILYVVLAMRTTALEHWASVPEKAGYEVLVNLLNNMTCIPFIAMYYELAEKTVEGSQEHIKRLWWPLALFFILGAATEFAVRVTAPDYSYQAGYWASLISGMISGVSAGLFVSKLTCRLFHLPQSTVVLLTVYVVVQPVYPAITSADPAVEAMMLRIGYAVVLTALFTKMMLLYVVEWRRDTFGILFFMLQADQIDEEERVRRRYNDFYSIAEKVFSPKARSSAREGSWGRFTTQRAISGKSE